MIEREVAFLGPVGTYSHLVAQKQFGKNVRFHPLPTVLDVCTFAAKHPSARGIVPIENSSGGAIYETVDILLENRPHIYIEQELSLHVILALIGRRNEKTTKLFSHFVPLEHCNTWIKQTLPRVEKHAVSSTAVAALRAAAEWGGAALGSRTLAKLYGLDILEYPVETDMPNITTFYVVSGRKVTPEKPTKTTLCVKIPNEPGSLYNLLGTFQSESVNLSRLISRPIRGCPREYAFLVDVSGGLHQPNVRSALTKARKLATEIRVAGSYPCRRSFRS